MGTQQFVDRTQVKKKTDDNIHCPSESFDENKKRQLPASCVLYSDEHQENLFLCYKLILNRTLAIMARFANARTQRSNEDLWSRVNQDATKLAEEVTVLESSLKTHLLALQDHWFFSDEQAFRYGWKAACDSPFLDDCNVCANLKDPDSFVALVALIQHLQHEIQREWKNGHKKPVLVKLGCPCGCRF